MKSLFAIPFCCFLLARSAFAIPTFDHVDAENKLKQRQRDLKDDTPFSKNEIATLKRMLSNKILRVNDDVSNIHQPNRKLANSKYASDPLANAMYKSALEKTKPRRRAGKREIRGVQDAAGSRKLQGLVVEDIFADAQSPKQPVPPVWPGPEETRTAKAAEASKSAKAKEKSDPKSPKKSKDPKSTKDPKSPNEPKSTKAPKEQKDPKEPKGGKQATNTEEVDAGASLSVQGRMGDMNESSEIQIESTTRSSGYRNSHSRQIDYYDYGNRSNGNRNNNNRNHNNANYNNGHRNGNRNGNRNGYYDYSYNRRPPQNTPPLNGMQQEDVVFESRPQQQRAEIPNKISFTMEAFQDSRMIQDPVLSGQSYLSAGTQYLYVNEPLFNVVYDVPPNVDTNRPVYLVNERDKLATVSGECIRTDPKVNYQGRAYCQFEYSFLDQQGEVEASISASGPVSKYDVDTLSITGGTGIFRRTVGTIVLESGVLKRGSPPYFVGDDDRDLPTSYLVKMFVFIDSVDFELARNA